MKCWHAQIVAADIKNLIEYATNVQEQTLTNIYFSEYIGRGVVIHSPPIPFALNELKLTWNVDYYILYRMRGAQIVAADIKKV